MDLVTLALARKYTNEKVAELGDDSGAVGFGMPTASVTQLESTEQPTVSVTASGPNTEKVFSFEFGIPAAPAYTLTENDIQTIVQAVIAAMPNNNA